LSVATQLHVPEFRNNRVGNVFKERNIYYWQNSKPREEVFIFVVLRYVTSKADTFVMVKEILELSKNNADQKVTELWEISVKTCGSVRQIRVNKWPYCMLAR